MRIYSKVVRDIESGRIIEADFFDYDGPVAFAKGSGYAQGNMNTANNLENQYSGQALGINAGLIPVYQSEITNPIGFGQQAVTQMKTEGAQTAAGAQGAADEQARLAAARTGNNAALPSIQDKLARSATSAANQNALGVDIANTQAKLAQQQSGISGLSALGAEDTGAGLNALGLSNQALNEYMQAANWWEQPFNSIVSGLSQSAGKAI